MENLLWINRSVVKHYCFPLISHLGVRLQVKHGKFSYGYKSEASKNLDNMKVADRRQEIQKEGKRKVRSIQVYWFLFTVLSGISGYCLKFTNNMFEIKKQSLGGFPGGSALRTWRFHSCDLVGELRSHKLCSMPSPKDSLYIL